MSALAQARLSKITLALATAMSGCAHGAVASNAAAPDALSFAVLAALDEVVVTSSAVDAALPGWDSQRVARLLGDAVIAEGTRRGIRQMRWSASIESPREHALTSGAGSPPIGQGRLGLRVQAARLAAITGPDERGVLALDVALTIAATQRSESSVLSPVIAAASERSVLLHVKATTAVLLVDPHVIQAGGSRTGDAAEVQGALDRLTERGARRIVDALLATAADGAGDHRDTCGPSMLAAHDDRGADRDLAWAPWTLDAPGVRAEITYDLRVWRYAQDRSPEPVIARDGLTARTFTLDGLVAGSYGWTVRGVAALADGRRVASPWAGPRREVDGCATAPDPVRARRFELRTEAADSIPSAPPSDEIQIATAYETRRVETRTPRAGSEMSVGREAAKGAGGGALVGLSVGLRAAFVCGPIFFLCAMITAPAGTLTGAVVGAGVGATTAAVENSAAANRQEATPEPILAVEPIRSALRTALARHTGNSSFLARLRDSANSGRDAQAGVIELTEVEVKLLAEAGDTRPATLELAASGRVTGGTSDGPHAVAAAAGPQAVAAHLWLEDDDALLVVGLEELADRAGAALSAALGSSRVGPATLAEWKRGEPQPGEAAERPELAVPVKQSYPP